MARENYAILVGVSRYENLDERYWLNGPANDVRLALHYLTNSANPLFKRTNIEVLADGVKSAKLPTLAAIRSSFEDVTGKVQQGDFVYVHFAGHGAQAPALQSEQELDGLDEVFLPIDIGPWSIATGMVQNGLVDDEIGQMLDRLLARGVDVWVVFDSCHSGTATRSASGYDDDIRLRKVTANALGIPESAIALPEAGQMSRKAMVDEGNKSNENTGSLTAFFAAQTNETTPEMRLPSGNPVGKSQGVFSYVLFETMLRNPGISYRQLGQEILRQYSVNNLTRTTPMFSGSLDKSLFSASSKDRIFQWPLEENIEGYSIAAGSVHGLEAGDRLILLPKATDTPEKGIGEFTVTEAQVFSSKVIALGDFDIPRGGFLRAEQSSLHLGLTVAMPQPSGQAELDTKAQEAMKLLASRHAKNDRLKFVEVGGEAEMRLAFVPQSNRPEALWLLPSTGLWEQEAAASIPSVSVPDKSADVLANNLEELLVHIGRAQNLLKLGGAIGIGAADIEANLLVKEAQTKELRKMEPASIPSLYPDDEVHLQAINISDNPMDVNVLFVGSDYSIAHIFAGRLQPGDKFKKGLLRITDTTVGRERILVIANPAKQHSSVQHLGFLQQDAINISRGTDPSSFIEALSDVGFGQSAKRGFDVKGFSGEAKTGKILQFEINVKSGQRATN